VRLTADKIAHGPRVARLIAGKLDYNLCREQAAMNVTNERGRVRSCSGDTT